MSKKMGLFSWWNKDNTTDKQLGSELTVKEGVKAEIEKFQGDIIKTSRTYQNNIKKYKEIAKFNEELTKNYVQNWLVFKDVSEMLSGFMGVFKSLQEEFSKMEEATGKPVNTTDFDYLANITKNKIETLNIEINKQAENLKKVYTEYGRPEELNRIIVAQGNMNKLINNATNTYNKVTEPEIAITNNQANKLLLKQQEGGRKSKSKTKSKKNVKKNTKKHSTTKTVINQKTKTCSLV